MRPLIPLCASLLVCSTVASAQHKAKPTVETEIIGQFPGSLSSVPIAINNKGQVVGYATYEEGGELRFQVFVWSRHAGFQLIAQDAIPTDINERGDISMWWFRESPRGCSESEPICGAVWRASTGELVAVKNMQPEALNNRGEVAGSCGDGDYVCTFMRNVVRRAQCVPPHLGDTWSAAVSTITERGEVLVNCSDSENAGFPTGFVVASRDGRLTRVSGPTWGADMNNAGLVAGYTYVVEHANWSAFVWTKMDGVQLLRGGTPSVATAVNARGWVTGYQFTELGGRAVVWTGIADTPIVLAPEMRSFAVDLNDRGEILGFMGNDEFPGDSPQIVVWRVRQGGAQRN